MKPAGRASAAIDILGAVLERHLPATEALREWGRSHRFAGSRDRAAIGTIVHDALRQRHSLAWRMGGEESPRALVLSWLAHVAGKSVEEIEALGGAPFGFGALSESERKALMHPRPLDDAPDFVRGDYPQWLAESFAAAFGDDAAAQGAALARRAPLDIRVNTLKASREKAARALSRFSPSMTPHSPWGLRFQPNDEGRLPNVEADGAHGRGWFEVQDEGSQTAALACGAKAGEQVLDLCAGAGGKTLALAAMMGNRGQIFAHDANQQRLRPIFERIRRAGARNVQVIEAHAKERLAALKGRMDLVLVDAPCSGSGTWRRKPDAKWRLRDTSLAARRAAQAELLRQAADFVRPGGRLVYVTCSVLPEENTRQVEAFLAHDARFALADWREGADEVPEGLKARGPDLRLTPLSHGTDGFYAAVMTRRDKA